MKLLNNLYTISKREGNSFQLNLNRENGIYKAHFPERPVTPGVCVIQMATELLEILIDKQATLKEVVNAKFLSVINPIETPSVAYTFSKLVQDDAHTLKVSIMVASQSTNCAKLSLLYIVNE